MSINRIIMLTVITSFVVFGVLLADGSESTITIEKYLGEWYDVAVISPRLMRQYPIVCQWVNVTRRDDNRDSFDDVFTSISNGQRLRTEGRGTIVDSEIHIEYSNNKEGTVIYTVESYNNGHELIVHDKDKPLQSALLSRNRTIAMTSVAARNDFENLAKGLGGYVYFIDNQNC